LKESDEILVAEQDKGSIKSVKLAGCAVQRRSGTHFPNLAVNLTSLTILPTIHPRALRQVPKLAVRARERSDLTNDMLLAPAEEPVLKVP
jgi:hypothetical protein